MVTGVAALAVLLAVFISWKEIASTFLLRRLQARPEALKGMLEKDPRSISARAIERFLGTDRGRQAFLGLYVEILESVLRRGLRKGTAEEFWDIQKHPRSLFMTKDRHCIAAAFRASGIPRFTHTAHLPNEDELGFLDRMNRFLPGIHGIEVRLPRFPDRTFQVVGLEELPGRVGYEYAIGPGIQSRKVDAPKGDPPPDPGHPCIFIEALQPASR